MSSSTCTSTRSRLTTSLTIATLALTSYYIYRRITTRRTKGPAHLISQQYLPCEYRRLNITVALCDDIDDPHLRQQLWDVCQLYFAFCTKKPIWNDTIVPTSFIITQVDGGITNRLYHCSYGTRSILIRIYGPRTELVIDRARENAVVDYLSQKGWSGKVYGRFLNGRLEQWFDGYHAVKPSDMAYPPLQPLIACELAHMHQLDPASGTYIPLDQDPHIAKPQPISTLLPRSITIWRTLFKWLDRARDITFDDPIKQKQLSELNLDWWSSELHSYHTLMQSSPIFADTNTSVLVFAHNDLLSGNVLYHAQQKRVRFIDFEYGAYNPRGFDIANHWLECCGFGCDWAQFPTPTQQASFARTYLATIHHVDESSISESDVDALINEVHGWLLADHFFWGLWGIVQAKYSPIAFDYLSYSLLRHKGYRMMRSQSWKCVQQTIPK